MYGGTAKTYSTWKMDGQPFKEGKVYYVNVIHPKTNTAKKVRFYTDKAHAELMPNTTSYSLHKTFCFDSEDDWIYAVNQRHISAEEAANYLSGKWRFTTFFGGIWYAPKTAALPPIRRQKQFKKVYWADFKAEAKAALPTSPYWKDVQLCG